MTTVYMYIDFYVVEGLMLTDLTQRVSMLMASTEMDSIVMASM
jgi:hypothetical protein